MKNSLLIATSVVALLTIGAGSAAAQQLIRPNTTVAGSLDSRDPVSSTGGHFERWRIDAEPGELVVLRMDSGEFDPLLQIGRSVPGGQFYELASDDDGAGYPNALLQYRVTEGGPYEVRATSYSSGGYGGYSLSRSTQAGGGSGLPIDIGGYIDLDDPVDRDGRHYEAYRFALTNQQVIRIRQESDSLDTYVMLGVVGDNGEWIGLFHDDDSGGSLNSEFNYQAVSDEVFEVRASTYQAGAVGPYRLTVEDVSATPDGGMRPGMITGGWLANNDNPDGEGRYIEYRTFYAVAGQHMTVSLRSDEFDAYLRVGQWSNGAFHEMWFDDDSGDGNTGYDAQVNFVAPFTGTYTVVVTSFGADEQGLFSLEVEAR